MFHASLSLLVVYMLNSAMSMRILNSPARLPSSSLRNSRQSILTCPRPRHPTKPTEKYKTLRLINDMLQQKRPLKPIESIPEEKEQFTPSTAQLDYIADSFRDILVTESKTKQTNRKWKRIGEFESFSIFVIINEHDDYIALFTNKIYDIPTLENFDFEKARFEVVNWDSTSPALFRSSENSIKEKLMLREQIKLYTSIQKEMNLSTNSMSKPYIVVGDSIVSLLVALELKRRGVEVLLYMINENTVSFVLMNTLDFSAIPSELTRFSATIELSIIEKDQKNILESVKQVETLDKIFSETLSQSLIRAGQFLILGHLLLQYATHELCIALLKAIRVLESFNQRTKKKLKYFYQADDVLNLNKTPTDVFGISTGKELPTNEDKFELSDFKPFWGTMNIDPMCDNAVKRAVRESNVQISMIIEEMTRDYESKDTPTSALFTAFGSKFNHKNIGECLSKLNNHAQSDELLTVECHPLVSNEPALSMNNLIPNSYAPDSILQLRWTTVTLFSLPNKLGKTFHSFLDRKGNDFPAESLIVPKGWVDRTRSNVFLKKTIDMVCGTSDFALLRRVDSAKIIIESVGNEKEWKNMIDNSVKNPENVDKLSDAWVIYGAIVTNNWHKL